MPEAAQRRLFERWPRKRLMHHNTFCCLFPQVSNRIHGLNHTLFMLKLHSGFNIVVAVLLTQCQKWVVCCQMSNYGKNNNSMPLNVNLSYESYSFYADRLSFLSVRVSFSDDEEYSLCTLGVCIQCHLRPGWTGPTGNTGGPSTARIMKCERWRS